MVMRGRSMNSIPPKNLLLVTLAVDGDKRKGYYSINSISIDDSISKTYVTCVIDESRQAGLSRNSRDLKTWPAANFYPGKQRVKKTENRKQGSRFSPVFRSLP
jgi:hypothetical protein